MKAQDVADTMKKPRRKGKGCRKAGKCSAKFRRAEKAIEEKGKVDNPYAVAHAAVGK